MLIKGVEVLSFQNKFYLDPDLIRHYPEIAPYLEESTNGVDNKRFLDVESVYSDRFCSRGLPKVLIFTSIVSQPASKLLPIKQTSALINLTKHSASIFFNRQAGKVHFEILKRLVPQTNSYQLLVGLDLYEGPDKISEVLSGAM